MEALITNRDPHRDRAPPPEPEMEPDGIDSADARSAEPSQIVSLDSDWLRSESNLAWRSEQLKQAQAQLLIEGSRLAALLTLLAAPLLAYLLKDSVPRFPLLIWTGMIACISVVRLIALSYRKGHQLRQRNVRRVKLSMLFWNGVSGLAWGSTAVLTYPPDSLPQQILLLLILAGVITVALTVHSGMLGAVAVFTLPATLPMVARLLSEHSSIHDQLAGLVVVFLMVTMLIAIKMHRLTLRGTRVGVDNADLVDHLKQAKQETDKLNAELRHEIAVRRNTEARLRRERDFNSGVLDTESAVVIVLDRDGRILRFNRACESATGFYSHEVTGKEIWDTLLAPDQVAHFRQHFNAVAGGFFPSECEIQWRSKSGGIRLIQLSNTAILGSDGRCTHVVSTGVDVTDRRKTEVALAHTRENFELLIEGVSDYAIYMLDREGTIVSWNTGAERISGYTSEAAIGAHYSEFFTSEDPVSARQHIELRLAATEGQYEREGWYLKRDGKRFWATFTINPVKGAANELRGFSVIINDITVRKNTEDTIRSLLTITEQLNASLDLDLMMEALVRESLHLVKGHAGYAGLLATDKVIATSYFSNGKPTGLRLQPTLASGALPGHVLHTQRPYLSNTAGEDPRVQLDLAGNAAPGSVLCAPIIDVAGETLGFIEIHDKTDGSPFSESDCRKLVSAANSAALAIQNAKSYQAIKDAEALLSDETAILEAIAKRQPTAEVLQTIANVAETRCEGSAACIVQHPRWQERPQVICSPSIQCISVHLNGLPECTALPRIDAIGAFDVFDASSLLAEQERLHTARKMGFEYVYVCPIDAGSSDNQGLLLLCRTDALKRPQTLSVLEKIRHLAGIAIERSTREQDLQIRDQAIRSSMSAILLIDTGDNDFTIMYANEAAEQLSRTPAGQLTGQGLMSVLSVAVGEQLASIEQALRHGKRAYASLRLPDRPGIDGAQWIEVYVTPVRNLDNELRHSIVIMNDISERVRAQQALEESEARMSAMTANIPGMVYQYLDSNDNDSGFVYVSRGAREVIGMDPETLLSNRTRLASLIVREDLPGFEDSHLRAQRSQSTWHWEGRMLTPDAATPRWIDLSSSPRLLDNGSVLWDGIIFDVSSRKQAEFDLARSRELLRSLSRHLQNVREEEKATLARELHDELGSMLTTLKIEISSLKKLLPADLPEQTTGAIVDTVDEAIATTRRISTNLRPPILDSLGLLHAIEWQLEQFRKRTGMPVDLHISGDSSILGKDQTIAIFRIVQEGLTNVARHAHASRVSVAVAVNGDSIALDLIDDGKGFTVNTDKPSASYGLYSMQERARALAGTMDIISQPGQGTRLKVRVPLTQVGGKRAS